jgi:hypothetical protein
MPLGHQILLAAIALTLKSFSDELFDRLRILLAG